MAVRGGALQETRVQDVRDNLAVILDHVGDGVTVQDATGRLVYANTAAAQALGFATPADLLNTPLPEVLGRFAVFDEAGLPFPLEHLPGRRALRGETEPAVTVRSRIHATGEERWSAVRASPVVDAAGRVVLAVNVWQDVTARKRAEDGQRFLAEAGEALAASLDIEATLTNIAQLAVPRLADWCAVHLVRGDGSVSQLAVVHVDPERVSWALRLQEHYAADPDADQGVTRAVRTGRPQLIPEVTDEMLVAVARDPEHLALLRGVGLTSAMILPMIARDSAVGAITFVTAESGRRYDDRDLELTAELARRAALAVDNARLYDAERAARLAAEEARGRFRTLFEGVPDAILVIDGEGRFVEANAAACDLLGYALHDLLAMRLQDLAPDPLMAPLARAEAAAEARAESELRRRDDTLIPVEIWWRRLGFPTGPIDIAVVRDISERREADQIREELLTAIAHDLRNPLGSIKLQTQTLQRSIRRGGIPDPKRLDDGLAAIDAMTTRVASLLEDIVDLARERGEQGIPFDPEPTDLVALTERCVEEIRSSARHDVRVEAAEASLVGMWDSRGMERVLLNLLNNAVKYSPGGSPVTVRVERVEGEGAPSARLVVEDEGIGIPAADLTRIFERYLRGRNVGQIAGTGMGLPGARQIVERHGGTIAVSSADGRGTQVTVELPLNGG
jgi:PAS domain S-box-containing protein